MTSKKYRISIAEGTGKGSTSYSPIDVDNCGEFFKYLKEQGVKKFNLKYYSIIDDIPDFYEIGLSINDFKQEHFDWLTEKSKYQSRSLEVANYNKPQLNMKTRKKNFKLGEFHGTLSPKNLESEAKLRNDIFLIGQIGLEVARTEKTIVRIIAKEMPLQEEINRGNCIDLFGIDKNWIPYVIELKLKENKQKLIDIVKQVSDYSDLFEKARKFIEMEMEDKLFYKAFKFNGLPKKIILSENEYRNEIKLLSQYSINRDNLFFCKFSRTTDLKDSNGINLLDKRRSSGIVNLSIFKK